MDIRAGAVRQAISGGRGSTPSHSREAQIHAAHGSSSSMGLRLSTTARDGRIGVSHITQ